MHRPVQPGERAPELTLPAVNRDGAVSLSDFRGRRAVMIGFFRGLHCPFCRRQIAQLGAAQPALAALGVETVAVVNTPLERAQLYFRYRPTPLILLSDPECRTHRMFGIPRIEFLEPGSAEPAQWPRTRPEDFAAARIDPTGELGAPTQPVEANGVLNRRDGFELTAADEAIFAVHGTQFAGQFLLDRDGIVRWCWTEAPTSAAELCRFPSAAEMIEAARGLATLQT
jgi:peroxiredoxin